MSKVAVIFGGSGYIGTNLLSFLFDRNSFDKYYVFDINPLKGFDKEKNKGTIVFQQVDVRKGIDVKLVDIEENSSWLFNL